MNPDPEKNPSMSYYSVLDGNPILKSDILGNVAGDYYKTDGTYLGSDGKTDDKVYTATGVQGSDADKKFLDANELSITHTDFKKFSGLVYNEDNSTMQSAYGTASAVVNYNNFRNANGKSSTLSGLLSGTYSYASKAFAHDNSNPLKLRATGAVINALTGGHDYSNGATHWDGFDAAGKGFSHVKPSNQGVEISYEHFEAFRAAWPDTKLNSYSHGVYTSFSSNYSAGMHQAPAKGSNPGRILFKSSAVLGNTIFWKPNIDPVILRPPKIRDFMGQNPTIVDHVNAGYKWKNL